MIIRDLSSQLSADFGLHEISFEVQTGQILTLLGKSGSGKSSLLRCMAGLQPFQAKQCDIKRPLGMIFQSANLFSHLSLEKNIQLALKKVQKKSEAEAQKICDEVLEQVQLKHRCKARPHELSGGEQQRGTIARALALKPQVLLYDEPTSALDPELVDEVFDLMVNLKSLGLIQVVVSHETRVVKRISDCVGFMSQGRLKWFGSVRDLPQHLSSMEENEQKYLQLFI